MDSLTGLTSVSSDYVTKLLSEKTSSSSDAKSESFDEIYNAAVNMISGTNSYIQQAQQAEIDYAMGKLTSTHELSIIEEKANIALQYTVAVKNGLISAYKEIMQIQI